MVWTQPNGGATNRCGLRFGFFAVLVDHSHYLIPNLKSYHFTFDFGLAKVQSHRAE
jgi:hypothetical protein